MNRIQPLPREFYYRALTGIVWLLLSTLPFFDGQGYVAAAFLGIGSVWLYLAIDYGEDEIEND